MFFAPNILIKFINDLASNIVPIKSLLKCLKQKLQNNAFFSREGN